MKISASLPTAFARQLAIGVDLLPPGYDLNSVDDYEIDKNRLAQFQQLAVSGEFEDAMLAYHGLDLDFEKLAALRVIYKTTKPWLMGHVVGELLVRMESVATNSKEALEIAQMITTAFGGTASTADPEKKKGLLLRFANQGMSVEVSDAQD